MSLEKKITKLYMTAVAGIYVMFIVGGGTILLDVMLMKIYNINLGVYPVVMGLFILSILFGVYLTLLKKRMFALFQDDVAIASGVALSDLDDTNNYGG